MLIGGKVVMKEPCKEEGKPDSEIIYVMKAAGKEEQLLEVLDESYMLEKYPHCLSKSE